MYCTAETWAAGRRVRGVEFEAHTDCAICSLHTESVHTNAPIPNVTLTLFYSNTDETKITIITTAEAMAMLVAGPQSAKRRTL